MIGYVTLGTNDIDRAAAFYDGLLGEMGIRRLMDGGSMIGWGASMQEPMVCVTRPFDGNGATVGNGARVGNGATVGNSVMVALGVATPEDVARLHAKALELGATDEGASGPRDEGFHAGYFRDPDGNKLNFFCFAA